MPIDNKTAKAMCRNFKIAGLALPPEDDRILVGTLERRARSDRHAQAIVDAWIERSREWPKPADIAQLAAELDDPKNIAKATREDCQFCNGSGYRSVEGEYGITGAYPCTHKPMSEADHRMGIRMAPAVAKTYAEELGPGGNAEQREIAWRASPQNPMNWPPKSKPITAPLRRVGWDDIDRLKAGLL